MVILLDTASRHLIPGELYSLLAVTAGVHDLGQFELKAVRLGIWRLTNDPKAAGHRAPRGNWCDEMSLQGSDSVRREQRLSSKRIRLLWLGGIRILGVLMIVVLAFVALAFVVSSSLWSSSLVTLC